MRKSASSEIVLNLYGDNVGVTSTSQTEKRLFRFKNGLTNQDALINVEGVFIDVVDKHVLEASNGSDRLWPFDVRFAQLKKVPSM